MLTALVLTVMLGTAGVVVVGSQALHQALFDDGTRSAGLSIAARVDLWRRGILMLLDMPLTGIGMHAFPFAIQSFYPLPRGTDPSVIQDAHNVYLQTALDLGLPGLFAVAGLSWCAIRGGVSAVRIGHRKTLVVGLMVGLCAYGLHGIIEAAGPGSWSALEVWAFLGVLAASRVDGMEPVRSHHHHRTRLSGVRHSVLRYGAAAVAIAAVSGPIVLNAANVVLHRPDAAAVAKTEGLQKALNVASALAWGPLEGRVWVAQSVQARSLNDDNAEQFALRTALDSRPSDPTVSMRLADLALARSDTNAAVASWRRGGLIEVPLGRAAGVPSDTALWWLGLAQQVDPSDWRPYARSAAFLQADQPRRADSLLSEAFARRGQNAARAVIAHRLQDPTAPLPEGVSAQRSAVDARLFAQAANQLEHRFDFVGAVYAMQFAEEADPSDTEVRAQARDLGIKAAGQA